MEKRKEGAGQERRQQKKGVKIRRWRTNNEIFSDDRTGRKVIGTINISDGIRGLKEINDFAVITGYSLAAKSQEGR